MALLKEDKKKLAKEYLETLQWAKNAVVLQQDSIPVNEVNKVRRELAAVDGKLVVIKKRVFLKGIEGKYEGLKHENMNGSVAVLYSYNKEDEHAPLKVIYKYSKARKKDKLKAQYNYVGWRYESIWKDSAYVSELASLPSKEELVGKLLFMLNHPVSSFARVLQAIADKDGESVENKEETNESTETKDTESTSENKNTTENEMTEDTAWDENKAWDDNEPENKNTTENETKEENKEA